MYYKTKYQTKWHLPKKKFCMIFSELFKCHLVLITGDEQWLLVNIWNHKAFLYNKCHLVFAIMQGYSSIFKSFRILFVDTVHAYFKNAGPICYVYFGILLNVAFWNWASWHLNYYTVIWNAEICISEWKRKRIHLFLILLLFCVHFGTKDGLLSVPSKVSLSGQVVELDSGCLKLIVVWLFIISIKKERTEKIQRWSNCLVRS